MILGFLIDALQFVLRVYEIVFLVYAVLPWFSGGHTPIYQFLARLCEPVLAPIRGLLIRYLPRRWQRFDWSPVAAILLCDVASALLRLLARLF